MGPFDTGGYLKPGKVYFAPEGTELVLSLDQWQELGKAGPISFDVGIDEGDAEDTIRTQQPVIETSLTFACIPPTSRREKRQQKKFWRLLFGPRPPKPLKRRQLIHNGRKP